MQKRGLYWSRLAMGCGTVVCGFLWINNLVAALVWHWQLFRGVESLSRTAVGGLNWLAWSTLDASTVTTFVPFFGFLLMLVGTLKPGSRENWPFFEGYERLNVALGLLGTIWGIILIGFYPVGEVTINALMYCLHTAMFSTLAAVLWVMVLLPLIFRPWLTAIRESALEVPAAEEDFGESIDRLLSGVRKSGAALNETAEQAGSLAKAVQILSGEIAHWQEETQNARTVEAAWRSEALAAIKAFAALAEELQRHQMALTDENLHLQEEKRALSEDLAAAQANLTQFRQQLDAIRNVLR